MISAAQFFRSGFLHGFAEQRIKQTLNDRRHHRTTQIRYVIPASLISCPCVVESGSGNKVLTGTQYCFNIYLAKLLNFIYGHLIAQSMDGMNLKKEAE